MILLSISPFIFIQCGSGVPFDGRPLPYWKGAPRFRGAPFSFYLKSPPPAASGRLFALPQHLPQSRHRPQSYFLAAGVSRHQPKKYSKRS